jgi:hypothetical protein
MPLYFVLMNFAPCAVLSGLLAALALLFWYAAQWQGRKVADSRQESTRTGT